MLAHHNRKRARIVSPVNVQVRTRRSRRESLESLIKEQAGNISGSSMPEEVTATAPTTDGSSTSEQSAEAAPTSGRRNSKDQANWDDKK